MYLSLLPASLLLSLAAAQTTTTQSVISVTSAAAGTASVCAAQPVLEACLASTEAIAGACSSTDYQCLCSKWNDVLTYAYSTPSGSPMLILLPDVSTTALTTPDIPPFSQTRRHTVTICLFTPLQPPLPSPAPSPLPALLLLRQAQDLLIRRLRAQLELFRLRAVRRALLPALPLARAVREAI